jgi:steroid delta-isomerase-like uncharacterized protein
MSTTNHKALGYQWAEVWDVTGSPTVIDEIVAATFASHNAPSGLPAGRAGLKQWVQIFHNGFPDLYCRTEDVIAEGDKVVQRFTGGGTHRGEFFGIPATGKPFTLTGINIFRIEDGQIVEHWVNMDEMGVLRQLGVTAI